jgi:hypothetical protein
VSILRNDAHNNRTGRTLAQARKSVLVSGRLEKWKHMVQYGLDPDLAAGVIIKQSKTAEEPIGFSKYAKVGLMNFYETYPYLFMSRLSKGPPP